MVQLLLDKARALLAPAPKFYFGLCGAVGVFWLVVALNLIVCAARAYYFYGVEDRIFSRIFEDFCCILIINLLIFHLCFVVFRRFFGLAALFALAINALCAAISLFLVIFFDSAFNVVALDAIIHTDANESKEFAAQFLSAGVICSLLAFATATFVALKFKKSSCSARLRAAFSVIYPICVVIFCIFTATKIASGGERYRATLGTYAPLEFAFVVKDYLGDANFLADLQSIERGYDEAKRANSALDFNATQIKNVVLIIGESLQRGHMSLYGYGKDTTPLLNDLQRRGLLIKFSDTVSCYGAANPALMRILNFSDYESERERPWFESLSIIDMFALSGFRTMWISNQEAFGKFALSAKSAADRAEKKHLSFHKRSAR